MATDRLSIPSAWLVMADWWDRATVCGCGCGRMEAQTRAAGLCSCLSLLRFRGLIDDRQEQRMLAALPPRGPVYVQGVRPFLWPTDGAGAKTRAEFCRAQARG